jgi:hypothetical protein
MKYVRCIFSEEFLKTKPSWRITHDKIYEVYSYENCKKNEFWIMCDNMTKGKYDLDTNKSYGFIFEDATAEIRDRKIKNILYGA